MTYTLWYWPSIPGRGEFVRLAMEGAGIAYVDAARDRGVDALVADMKGREGRTPFAPPYLDIGGAVVAQVANILSYLGEQHGLAPDGLTDRLWADQIQLTITDIVAEVHNVHHPVGVSAYYEDQKAEAARAARQFRDERIPKFLSWFDAAAQAGNGEWLVGDRWSHADTSLFQLIEGLRYMFPRRMAAVEGDYPALFAIRDRVAALPGIADYLSGDRRLPFNEDGIFRHYPELDGE